MFLCDLSPAQLALALLLAAIYDQCFASLPTAIHPVVAIGKLVGTLCRPGWYLGKWGQMLWGALVVLITIAITVALCSLSVICSTQIHPIFGTLVAAYWLVAGFALRLLADAAARVQKALLTDNLAEARAGLRWLCSRDPSELTAEQVAGAAIESVAENASDSVVAPLFFLVIFGLPGAIAYRAINTMDAMIGYHGRYEYLGKAAARCDDLANLVPARLCAVALNLGAAPHLRRLGWEIAKRDAKTTESPNAGWPMAMMAGLLRVRLDKVGHYSLGREFRPPQAADLDRARCLLSRTGKAVLGAAFILLLARHFWFK